MVYVQASMSSGGKEFSREGMNKELDVMGSE